MLSGMWLIVFFICQASVNNTITATAKCGVSVKGVFSDVATKCDDYLKLIIEFR